MLSLLLLALTATLPLASAFIGYDNPLKSTDGSDPFMVHYDGYYYLLTTTWSDIEITAAKTIGALATTTATKV